MDIPRPGHSKAYESWPSFKCGDVFKSVDKASVTASKLAFSD
jgi:hypothetical protein